MDDERVPESEIMHYGIIRRSGRYPWGSGGWDAQNSRDFKSYVEELRSQGLTEPQIAEGLGIKTTEYRDAISNTTEVIKNDNVALATRLSVKGMSNRAIADRILGDPKKESTVRGWLSTADDIKDNTLESIANLLKGRLGTSRWLDVGKGTELHMGISTTKLRAAVASLKAEGYKTHLVKLPQLGTDEVTVHKILGHPDSTTGEARRALFAGEVPIISETSDNGGLTFMKPKEEPVSISSKKIQVLYGPEGGDLKDGIIEVRRGVPELDLGANRYAQVRVAVDGTHYLKGMAMYADDELPPGINIRFNTPKENTGNKLDVMKPLDLSPEAAGNRFGASTRPLMYKDSKGKEVTSAFNVVGYGENLNVEGAWDKWSKSLSAQMLSKQSLTLASSQLKEARIQKQEELNKIMALDNPIVRKRLLLDFADSADSAAVHLKAAALPRQSSHVILPVLSMRPNEVYAPNFNSGERVALVRYPHGGPFEIPELTVNNKNTTAKRLLGGATDAIGIHPSVANQLSGADFDGDSVIVIPNDDGRVKSKPPLEALKDFEPHRMYPEAPGMTYMTKANTQKEMGKISNLITDMTIKGAKTDEIARAVKHSMVVIDAEKKKLNYKQSEKDNGIAQLKREYQGGATKGASTLISRSNAQARIDQVRARRASEGGPINPDTGELEFVPTGETRIKVTRNAAGEVTKTEVVPKQTKGTQGGFAKDANTLSSGQPIERIYAAHANTLKAMANTARKEAVSIANPKQSPAAKAIYANEVESLRAKLQNALRNAPLERRAQAIGNATANARIEATPDLDKEQIKKIRYQSLTDARLQVGAGKERIGSDTVPFTEREWEAVQSGAVSSSMLTEILNNSDMERVKELATPKYNSSLSTGQIALAKSLRNSGRSLSEIAVALGIPRSTIADNLANA